MADLSALSQQQTAKLVLLGEQAAGKSSLVLRYVKGQFFDYQVCVCRSSLSCTAPLTHDRGPRCAGARKQQERPACSNNIPTPLGPETRHR